MIKEKYILLMLKKLSGQISSKEDATLENWRKKKPDNESELSVIKRLWDNSESYSPTPVSDLEKAKSAFFTTVKKKERNTEIITLNEERVRPLWYWLGTAVASLLIISGVFYNTVIVKSDELPAFIASNDLVDVKASDEVVFEELSDGSRLWLNQESIIKYSSTFNELERVVYLYGEMFIDVAPNPKKPFLIKTENNEIKVLGTSFFIKAKSDELVELKVEEGVVEFSDFYKKKRIVKAGQQAYYDVNSHVFTNEGNQQGIGDNWRNAYLVFDDAPLKTVFTKLSVFYGVEFDINCKRIKRLKGFTSLIQNDNSPKLTTFLQSLKKVYGIEIKKLNDKLYKVSGDICN